MQIQHWEEGIIDVTWVCLKIGYIPNYSHLVGIMISKTIGFRGTRHFQTNPHRKSCSSWPGRILPTLDDDFRSWGDGQSTAWRRQMGRVKTHFDRGKLLSDMDRHGRGELWAPAFLISVGNMSWTKWGSGGWDATRAHKRFLGALFWTRSNARNRIMIPVDECMWYGLPPETGPDPTIGDIGASWPCGNNFAPEVA